MLYFPFSETTPCKLLNLFNPNGGAFLAEFVQSASGNTKALTLIAQISPAAWRHILLNGHYTFQSDGKMIDLDTLVAGVELE